MPFIYRNLILNPADGEDKLASLAAARLGLTVADLLDLRILRKGIDARKKPSVKIVYTISFSVRDKTALDSRISKFPDLEWQPELQPVVYAPVSSDARIIIVGSGPAGLFAAVRLAQYGLTATIIERGQPVEQRSLDVQQFWRDGTLLPESNVQFGEGGAGTFSDGKLTCRSKDPLVPYVLGKMVDFGAPAEIAYLAKPHIGTDRLRRVVSSARQHLLEKGFQIRFGCCLTDLDVRGGRLSAITVNQVEELPCDMLVLATGHSSRDTYELLERRGLALEQKPFAMGLRVEHPQELIDSIQYGARRSPALPAADYAVTYNNTASGRSAYSFCMCPGGVVVAGASEEGGLVTNGMSGQLRNSPYANSALVVNVTKADFGADDPLAGVRFQRKWEQQAYLTGGGGYCAPAQNLMSFLDPASRGSVKSTYRPGIVGTDLAAVLPTFITQTLREGIPDFGRRLRGFVTAEATLIGIESRTSAPLRILRDEHFESRTLPGLFPAGEGAGYAGGIMSSAIDGIKIADEIVSRLRKT